MQAFNWAHSTHRAAILAVAVPVSGFFVPAAALPLRYRSFFFICGCFIILSRFSCFGFFLLLFSLLSGRKLRRGETFYRPNLHWIGPQEEKSQEWRATGKVDHCDISVVVVVFTSSLNDCTKERLFHRLRTIPCRGREEPDPIFVGGNGDSILVSPSFRVSHLFLISLCKIFLFVSEFILNDAVCLCPLT